MGTKREHGEGDMALPKHGPEGELAAVCTPVQSACGCEELAVPTIGQGFTLGYLLLTY